MSPRWAHRVLAIAAALVAWLAATPARASAPICDHRGVTAIAPAPQLQPPTTSIDVGPSPEGECVPGLGCTATLDDGQTPTPRPPSVSSESVVRAETATVVLPSLFTRVPGEATDDGAREGVHARLERPPRG